VGDVLRSLGGKNPRTRYAASAETKDISKQRVEQVK
jgi:hypothetical protein